ncbi:hypothetical protein NUU61_002336 [Penicillium alfredii]|uniref:Sucrose transporter n=1 Tax=Penicillium alfredii TaxID=1506179 RepID=A0A9W9FRI5_9EURO|nr:uncharacterized protein NUU61_002336 [Penicillium alfredii]KAJ5104989.1 hypothetical protein NUU61_002336 [Penicillium alfredii]
MAASYAGDDHEEDPLAGAVPHVDESSKSGWYLFLLTLSIGGLQIVWSVELSNGSPFLLSLGMSKSLLAFVWIAGPLTGTLVQPYIGIRSDNCRISWGKRKPFMLVGSAATIVSLLALAWVKELVGGFLSIFGVSPQSDATKTFVIIVATILMYSLDFSINTVQAGIRAFIVDNCPAHQQELANAWASRLLGVGNILGYIFGYMDLPKALPFLGNTQFKVLCALASISLGATLFVSCYYIQERDPRLESPPASADLGLISFFRQVFKSVRNLPPQIARVCEVQVAAWVGWFPFLFYSTTYIGQLYVNPIFAEHPNLPSDKIDKAWEDATRIGTFALLIYAIISFAANLTLPILVVPTYKPVAGTARNHEPPDGPTAEEEEPVLPRRLSFSSMPTGTASEPLLDSTPVKDYSVEGKPTWLSRLQIPGLTLRRTWLLSHVLFAVCMLSTLFIYSHQAGSVAVGLVGISWAVTMWAPFALISAEVSRMDVDRRLRRREAAMATSDDTGVNAPASPQDSVENDDNDHDHQLHDSDLETGRPKDGDADESLVQAGIILGLHNVAISFPQILSSLICSAIFKAAQKPRGVPWDDSVGWVLRFGGCAALVAAWLTKRLAEGSR